MNISSISGIGSLSWQNILSELKAAKEKNEIGAVDESSSKANGDGRETTQVKLPALPADNQYIPGTLAEQLAEASRAVLEVDSDDAGDDAENKMDLSDSGFSKAMFDPMDSNQDGVISAIELAEGLENQRVAANSAENGQSSNSRTSSGQGTSSYDSTGQSTEETARNVASGRGLSVYMGMGGVSAGSTTAVWQGASSGRGLNVTA